MNDSLNTNNTTYSSNQNVSYKHFGYFNAKKDHHQYSDQYSDSANAINSGPNASANFGSITEGINYQGVQGQNSQYSGSLHSYNINSQANYSKESQTTPNNFQSNPQQQNFNVSERAQYQTRPAQPPTNNKFNQHNQVQSAYVNSDSNKTQQYLNPENIIHNYLSPRDLEKLKAIQLQKQLSSLPTNMVSQHYDNLEPQSKQITINTFEVLKLCLYIVPGLPVFLLIFRSIKDKEVMWHARQGLLMQVIWLFVYFVLQNLSLPLISGAGISLANIWNILCIGILVYAGSQAYIGKQYRIPVISDIGSTFIDGK